MLIMQAGYNGIPGTQTGGEGIMVAQEYSFELDCDNWGHFICGCSEEGKVVYRWHGTREQVATFHAEINKMSRAQQTVLVMDYEAQQIVAKAKQKAADLQTEVDREITKIRREAECSIDGLMDRFMEEDRELRDHIINNNVTLESAKELGDI